MPTKVLFVDDEPSILGIYGLLGPFIGEDCSVTTASGGEEALRLLQEQPFDVMVSDLTMPGMSGLELLATVAEQQPGMGRIVVSGFTDEITAAKCHILAHRYYTKPFSPSALCTEIASLCNARCFAANARVREYVGRINALPAASQNYLELTKALRSHSLSIHDVSTALEKDLALTAKLLQMVNSVSLAPARRITSVFEAVQLIGLEVVRALVLSTQVFELCHEAVKTELYQSVWKHSVRTAAAARLISHLENLGRDHCDEAFLAGLLHDIGKVVLAASCPEYHAMWHELRDSPGALIELETKEFGADHAHVGAYLLRLWGIPESTVEAVRNHHSDPSAAETEFSPLFALRVAHSFTCPTEAEQVTRLAASIGREHRIPIWQGALGENSAATF